VTDGYDYREGFYADDIFPIERYTTVTTLSSSIPDTFYNISDHNQGSFFFQVRGKDAQNQWGAWSNVQKAVVIQGFMRGDANGDNLITVSDVVFLINYLYQGGTAPDPYASGDANDDGIVNLGDLVYLINYLFKGGPSPVK
jgi:hypothetical protein